MSQEYFRLTTKISHKNKFGIKQNKTFRVVQKCHQLFCTFETGLFTGVCILVIYIDLDWLMLVKTDILRTYIYKSMFHSWLHKMLTGIKSCPLDWRTTIHCNVVRTIFQHKYNVSLFSNPGDQIQKRVKTMGQIFPLLSTRIRTLTPWIGEEQCIKMLFWHFNLRGFLNPGEIF